MGLYGMSDDATHQLLFWMSVVALVLSAWALWLSMAGYAPVWTTRPAVINFPSFAESDAWTRNPNVMKRQLTRQQKRYLHDRHGPVMNFGAQWGPPGEQGSPRPVVKRNWWTNN